MKLDGSIASATPAKLVRALSDPVVLAQIAPEGCEIGTPSGEAIPVKLIRKLGPVHLTLACTLTLTKKPDAPGFDLAIQGAHLIGGKVAVTLSLVPQVPQTGPKRLAWGGELTASGLAGRLVKDRDAEGQAVVKRLFLRLKQVVEAQSAVSFDQAMTGSPDPN